MGRCSSRGRGSARFRRGARAAPCRDPRGSRWWPRPGRPDQASPLPADRTRLASPRGGAERQLDAAAIYGPFRRAGASSGRPLSRPPHNGAAAAPAPAPAAPRGLHGRDGPGAARKLAVGARWVPRLHPCAGPCIRARVVGALCWAEALHAVRTGTTTKTPGFDGALTTAALAPPALSGTRLRGSGLARAAASRSHTQGPILPGSAQPYGKSASTEQPPLIQAQNVPQQGTITTLFVSIMDANGARKKNHLTPRDSQLITNHM